MGNVNHIAWSPMQAADVEAVAALGNAVHSAYPEEVAVFRSHYALYPPGCFVLRDGAGIDGYAMFHPWRKGSPPPLNQSVLPPDAPDCLHLHDIVIADKWRGRGLAGALVDCMREQAREAGVETLSLVAVSGTEALWGRLGFAIDESAEARDACRTYSDSARYMIQTI